MRGLRCPTCGDAKDALSALGCPDAFHSDEVAPSTEIVRAADAAQYTREPIPAEQRGQIRVRLLNATPDPLGSIAALGKQYKGEVVRSLSEVTDEERRSYLDDFTKTVLNGPLEAAQFHFQIEGVTRSITHQMVRSRASFFAQESLRFAVPEGNWADEIPLPPSLAGAREERSRISEQAMSGAVHLEFSEKVRALDAWEDAMINAQSAYSQLIESGVPAEEARGVLPHDMPTRIHWVLDLRTLLTEAGKRTCTQSQFSWRMIFAGIANALREKADEMDQEESRLRGFWTTGYIDEDGVKNYTNEPIPKLEADSEGTPWIQPFADPVYEPVYPSQGWQFALIADRLRPVCFQTGSCGFMAAFDRSCSIRSRVDAFARIGVDSKDWAHPNVSAIDPSLAPIADYEWAADPGAARS